MKEKITLLSILGARPQFIKIAPLIKALYTHNLKHRTPKIKHILVHTGQHYDYEMSKVFFKELKIPEPDYNLGVNRGNHGYQVGNMLVRLEKVLLKEKPDWVLVYGDTNSTLAGALAAAKLHIPVGHIEAGLRSFNRKMPEEINRVLTDHISNRLFCPTKTAVKNLKNEGITKGVYLVGDVMYDAILANIKLAKKKSNVLKNLNLKPKAYYLVTVHRAENTDNKDRLMSILKALHGVRLPVIFPVHPRTRDAITQCNDSTTKQYSNILFIKPVSYLDMLMLEKNAKKILTDSGGIQKEAYFLTVPCITLRDETEWVETLDDGWNILAGCDKNRILRAIKSFNPETKQHKYFGNGKTAKRIVRILIKQ